MKRKIVVLSIGAVFLVCASALFAEDRLVPSVYPTIQAGIDAAAPGDAVVIAAGTYTGAGNRDLDFGGSAITVRSADPNDPDVVSTTIIDCNGTEATPHRGFYYYGNEDSDLVIDGLTIANGYAGSGGAISYDCMSYITSCCTIRNCIIKNNEATDRGGGIYIDNYCLCDARISNCTFSNNTAGSGGGIFFRSFGRISNCIFVGNTATGGGPIAGGGGVQVYSLYGVIDNCTFSNNRAGGGGAVAASHNAEVILNNCILWGDAAEDGNEVWLGIASFATINYCDVEGHDVAVMVTWGPGNIDADPCFVDPCNGDYHLGEDSPCINAGDPCYVGEPCETDIDGDARVLEGRVDMGSDEVMSTPVIDISVGEFEFYGHEGSGNPEGQVLTIRNSGGGTLNWTISCDCNWLAVEPNSGSCNSGEANDVTLSVDISGLSQGFYDCTLLVSDANDPYNAQVVEVALRVYMGVIDYGDAPEDGTDYATTLARDGARHYLDFVNGPTVFLGEMIDEEVDGQPSVGADGDDAAYLPDEDGVLFRTELVPGGGLAEVEVTASCAGKLDAWIDFNADGDWGDANEQIFASEPLTAGSNILIFGVPFDANLGQTYARFRFSTAGGLYYSGVAVDGEVEDYVVDIAECMKETAPEYADWVAFGKPDCWCYRQQCRGDVDGLRLGPLVISINDLILFRLAINQVVLPVDGICSDFDHQALGPLRVNLNDLLIMRTYISGMFVPCCDNDRDCILDSSDKYNFWTEP